MIQNDCDFYCCLAIRRLTLIKINKIPLFVLFIFFIIFFFVSCSNEMYESSENNIEDSDGLDSMKKVVFLNDMIEIEGNDVALRENRFQSEYNKIYDNDTLYAFIIRLEHYYAPDSDAELPDDYPIENDYKTMEEYWRVQTSYEMEKVVETARRTGLMILSDYPYCYYNQENLFTLYPDGKNYILGSCAVAGTIEDMEIIFKDTPAIDGWSYSVWSAPRPDILERLLEAGADDEERLWFHTEKYKLKSILGDENQVTMSVEVE